MNDTNRILLQDGDSIVVDVTDEYDKILGLRQEARANVLRELEVQTRAKLIMLPRHFLGWSMEAL